MLAEAYTGAVRRLRSKGFNRVADRFERRGPDLDRTPTCVAIQHAVDACDCRAAAKLDVSGRAMWERIAVDQGRLAGLSLTADRLGVGR
jgi:hypothetical protein